MFGCLVRMRRGSAFVVYLIKKIFIGWVRMGCCARAGWSSLKASDQDLRGCKFLSALGSSTEPRTIVLLKVACVGTLKATAPVFYAAHRYARRPQGV